MAGWLDKLRLLRGLRHGEHAFVGPLFATAIVTRRCNLHCPGCPYHQPSLRRPGETTDPADLSLPVFEKFVNGLKAAKTRSLCLTGEGEPLLHPDLPQMVAWAKSAGQEVMVQTNATRLDARMARALCDAGLDELRVSLWATTVEEWRAEQRDDSPDQLEAALEGIARIIQQRRESRAHRPRVILHRPLTRVGARRVSALADLATRLGCDGVSFGLVHDRDRASANLVPGPAELSAILEVAGGLRRFLDDHGLSHNLDELVTACRAGEQNWQTVPCTIAWLHALLMVDGTIRPCCRCPVSLGDLNHQPLAEIWNGPSIRAFRRQAMSREGLARLAQTTCDCTFCPYLASNARVYAHARWLARPSLQPSCPVPR